MLQDSFILSLKRTARCFMGLKSDVRISTNIDLELTCIRGGVINTHLRGLEETHGHYLGNMKLKNNSYSHKNTWDTSLSQLQIAPNWNQSNTSSNEEFIQFTNRVIPNFPKLDIRVFIGGFRPGQKESYEANCSTILIQHRLIGSWNQVNSDFC